MIGELQAGDPQAVGPYRVLGRLGAGGMGQVYVGRSVGGRLVAVKVIRPELTDEPGFRARFAREVTAAKNVSGLFTALVVDADVEGPVPWLATAYVAGPSLAEAVETHGPRVIDFGISRAAEASMLTQSGMVVGSPGFMSPEQANGGTVGLPSDVFSMGAVLTFAATGEGPFRYGIQPGLALPRRPPGARPQPGARADPPAGRTLPCQRPRPAAGDERRPGRGGIRRAGGRLAAGPAR